MPPFSALQVDLPEDTVYYPAENGLDLVRKMYWYQNNLRTMPQVLHARTQITTISRPGRAQAND
jgi:hypothetical protein